MMQNTSHSLGIIPIALSKLLERLAFYGMRSILLLYMINQIALEQEKAMSVYGFFVMLAGILPILGGLFGDLLMSTKTTAIIGGSTQAIGCFILAIPSQTAVYIGLFLISLGAGFYVPNITSTLGSIYKNRIEKLDSAMLIFYISINVGALLGSFILGFTSDHFGYQSGFILCGIIMTGSQLILLLSQNLLKEIPKTANIYLVEKKKTNTGLRVLIIIATIATISIFWTLSELSAAPIYDRMLEIENFFRSYFYVSTFLNPITVLIGGTALAIIYSFVKSSSLLKICIGFIIFTLSSIIITYSHQNEMSNSFILFILFALFLQAIAELFISPVVFSIICQYGPAKFNATLIGSYSALSSLFSYATSYALNNLGKMSSTTTLLISIFVTISFAGIFLVLYLVTRQRKII